MQERNKYYYGKKISLIILCIFYIGAGINHFVHPKSYLALIPPYLFNYKNLINILSGSSEIIGGTLMIFPASRRLASILIIILLILFIPAHIYMIQLKGCVSETLCVPKWIAWVRLIPFQFILIWWAWKTYKWNS